MNKKSERDLVKKHFADILDHLESQEGVEAIGVLLPSFIASVLVMDSDAESREEGLQALISDVRIDIAGITAFAAATRQ